VDLPRVASVSARLEWLAAAASTNTELVAQAMGPDGRAWPDGSVLLTDTQTAGRGRLGRVWTAPAGTSLAISVLLRPAGIPVERLGWLSLAAGAAMTSALRRHGAPGASVKWPNDVLIGGRKVCGILAEALPDGTGAVVGAGLNHLLAAGDLPVPTATSLAIEGAETDVDAVVADYVARLRGLVDDLATDGGDAERSGLAAAVTAVCGTIGARVRVELPDGTAVTGEARAIDASGRLVVATDADSRLLPVAAGDVHHLRYE
jgi:BirA family transcriptional regulator, biotin operon repressor / biotin---[acetyl-CoA-carboxylase] ligase